MDAGWTLVLFGLFCAAAAGGQWAINSFMAEDDRWEQREWMRLNGVVAAWAGALFALVAIVWGIVVVLFF